MMTTVNEVNNDKTKVLDKFIFRSVLLVRLTAELDVSVSIIQFKNECECFITISKHEKTDESVWKS